MGTLASISNMGRLLQDMSKLEEAMPLLDEALKGYKETLGDRHQLTCWATGNLADLLRATGALWLRRRLYWAAVDVAQDILGSNCMLTLNIFTAKAVRLQHE